MTNVVVEPLSFVGLIKYCKNFFTNLGQFLEAKGKYTRTVLTNVQQCGSAKMPTKEVCVANMTALSFYQWVN